MATGKTSDKRKGSAVKAATRAKAPVKATAPPALSPFEEMDVLFDRLSRGLMSRMGFPALGEIGWPFQAHAPKVDVIDFIGTWVAALRERGVITAAEIPEAARTKWQEPHGDRRQELVFIGAGMDEPALRAALDGALLA